MKVKELIKALQALDQEAEIEVADEYWRNEGYDDDDRENASEEISQIRFHRGHYIIE